MSRQSDGEGKSFHRVLLLGQIKIIGGKKAEKLEPLFFAGGNVKLGSHFGRQFGDISPKCEAQGSRRTRHAPPRCVSEGIENACVRQTLLRACSSQ